MAEAVRLTFFHFMKSIILIFLALTGSERRARVVHGVAQPNWEVRGAGRFGKRIPLGKIGCTLLYIGMKCCRQGLEHPVALGLF